MRGETYSSFPMAEIDDRPGQAAIDLESPQLYVNRELALIEFQRRVLEEADDPTVPLLERVRFLSIFGSNMDEFFMIRLAGLKQQVAAGVQETGPDGMTPAEQLAAVRRMADEIKHDALRIWRDRLAPALAAEGIRILDYDAPVRSKPGSCCGPTSRTSVFPVLTPLAVDPSRPFPHISNLSLNLAVVIRDPAGHEHFARVKVPGTLPRWCRSPRRRGRRPRSFVAVEQLDRAPNLDALFPGERDRRGPSVPGDAQRRSRDPGARGRRSPGDDRGERPPAAVRLRDPADVRADDAGADPRRPARQPRGRSAPTRTSSTGRWRSSNLGALYAVDRPDLKEPPFLPAMPRRLESDKKPDIFAAVRAGDVLLHHPFDSFTPVARLPAKPRRSTPTCSRSR